MKNNVFTVKIDFEDGPLLKSKAKGLDGLERIFDVIKKKMS